MQPTSPSISVITVSYNAGTHLRATVRSVCSQTYPHIEYIIVDGGSDDGSLDGIQELLPHSSRLISEPDKGIYDAMNKGLKIATGDYVCFMNAGDRFASEETLTLALSPLTPPLPDVIYGDTDIVDADFRFVRRRRLRAPEELSFGSFKHGMVVCHQSFYARRSIAPMYDTRYRFSADVDWCLRILRHAKLTYNTHTTLTHYMEEGATTRNHRASLRERFEIMAKHYGLLRTLAYHLFFVLRAPLLK